MMRFSLLLLVGLAGFADRAAWAAATIVQERIEAARRFDGTNEDVVWDWHR